MKEGNMIQIKKVLDIYDCGSVTEGQEDTSFIGHPSSPFFMVYDGASARGSKGEKDIFSRTGSTVADEVGQIVAVTFGEASNKDELSQVILRANQNVKIFQETNGYRLDHAGLLSGGVLAAIKIGKEFLAVARTGDCFICVLRSNGEAWITDNQAYSMDVEGSATISKLMEKHGGDRDKMWAEFSRIVRESRLRDINQPRGNKPMSTAYGVLNGQDDFEEFLDTFEFPLKGIHSILLITDGATKLSETKNALSHAKLVAERYQEGGLLQVIQGARANPRSDSYVDADEATCIAIELE